MRGMSLVEVLVALVILSVGLLGIAHLLIHGLRTSHAALLRTQAVNLVADLAERIRANPLGAEAYAGGAVARGCDVSSCTAPERAEDDLATWQESLQAALPAVASNDVDFLAVDATHRYRISISWLEPGEAEAFSERADVVVARP